MKYPKVFISYRKSQQSRLDEAREIRNLLQTQFNFETWLDEDLKGGDIWRKEIDEKLDWADSFLLIVHSDLHTGKVVLDEVHYALEAVQSGKYKNLVCLIVEESLNGQYIETIDNTLKTKFPRKSFPELYPRQYISKFTPSWKDDLGVSFNPILKEQQGKAVNEAVVDGANKQKRALLVYEGLVYLLRPFSFKDKEVRLMLKGVRRKLNIIIADERNIISNLKRNKIILETGDYILVHDDDFGRKRIVQAFFGTPALLNLDIFKNSSLGKIKTILSSLAQIDNVAVENKLREYLVAIKAMIIKQDNDQRLESLNLLEKFAYRIPRETVDIINLLVDPRNEKRAKKYLKPFPRYGWEHKYILNKCLDVLNQYNVRYGAFHECFGILIKLYTYKFEEKEYADVRKRASDTMREIANYNLKLIRPKNLGFRGYGAQALVFEEIKRLLRSKDERLFDLAILLINKLFETEAEATYWGYKTMTHERGPLPLSKGLVKLRKQLIDEVVIHIGINKKNIRRLKCITALKGATTYPMNVYSALELAIMSNTRFVLQFYSTLKTENENATVLQEIDQQLSWVRMRLGPYKGENRTSATSLYKQADQLQRKIRGDTFYSIYRTLVGSHDFDELGGWRAVQDKREKEIQDFISALNEKSLIRWIKILKRIISTYIIKNDYAFGNFRRFLVKLGQEKPEISLKILKVLIKDIKPVDFLTYLLMGIRSSGKPQFTNVVARDWIRSKDFELIKQIPYFYSYVSGQGMGTVDFKIFDQLMKLRLPMIQRAELDKRVCSVISALYKDRKKELYKFFEISIKRASIQNVSEFCHLLGTAEFAGHLKIVHLPMKLFRLLVNKLVQKNVLDDYDTRILAAYGEINIFKLIDFFKIRILRRPKLKLIKLTDYRYDSIPYHLGEIGKLIGGHKDYGKILEKIIDEWIPETKDSMLSYEGREFIHNVSPDLDSKLKEILMNKIKVSKSKAKDVLLLLSEFDGNQSIDDLCIEAIKRYDDEDIRSMVSSAIYATGGVTGEYGFYNAHKERRDRVLKWKHGNNKCLKQFIIDFSKSLSKDMQKEKERVEVREELIKRGVDVFSLN